jgi:hypothetical protein
MLEMRKDLIVAMLGAFCLTVALFTIIPIRSQTTTEYDPWKDITDDGYIGIDDIVLVAESFGGLGDPTKNVNVTNWPTVQNVNVTNWPEDRSPTIKKGFQKILLMETFPQGLIVLYGYYSHYFFFIFEPQGQLINVTRLTFNALIRTSFYDVYDLCYQINLGPVYRATFDAANVTRAYPFGCANPTEITIGRNSLWIYRDTMTPPGDIYIYRLELIIEYYYYD